MKNTVPSVRRQLLGWLILPIMTLCLVVAMITYWIAINIATDAYDNTLVESSREVANRVRIEGGQILEDLPAEALEILREDKKDIFYYQVLDPSLHLIAGDSAIPLPAISDVEEEPDFRDDLINNKRVRVAFMKYWIPGYPGRYVVIQVAETVLKRQDLANEILIAVVTPQLALISLATLVVWLGVSRGLAPLQTVREAIARRTQWDLRPIDESSSPREIRPLVDAINDLLGRLDRDIEAQRRFVSNAAHQLRTPLAGLKTQTELALRQTNPDDLRHALKHMHTSAERATRLVNQLLSLAKFEPSGLQLKQLSHIDLNIVARDTTLELVPYALANEIDLGFEGSKEPAFVEGDSSGLQELISNLIDNAVRYTQKGGKVTVRVSAEERVYLSVEDNGPGIPEDERERVFERFYRVLSGGSNGSGLGLSIVREIAQAHNAEVTIGHDADGKGTMVELKFPMPKRQNQMVT